MSKCSVGWFGAAGISVVDVRSNTGGDSDVGPTRYPGPYMSRLCILTSSYPRDPSDNINSGVFARDFVRALAAVLPECCVFTHRKGPPGHYPDSFDVIEYRWLGRSTSLTSLDLRSPLGGLAALSLLIMGTFGYLRLCRQRRIEHSLALWVVPSGLFAVMAKWMRGVAGVDVDVGFAVLEFKKRSRCCSATRSPT